MSPVHMRRCKLCMHKELIMVVVLISGPLVKGQMHEWYVNNDD